MIAPEYSYYRDAYRGTMGEADYTRLSRRAAAYLEQVTFGRVNAPQPDRILQCVKDACCAVADALYQEENPRVTSETVQSWSKTYETAQTAPLEGACRAATMYLGMTGLLYRGV